MMLLCCNVWQCPFVSDLLINSLSRWCAKIPTCISSSDIFVPCLKPLLHSSPPVNTVLECKLKEYKKAVEQGKTETLAVAEHAWEDNHQVDWNVVEFLDVEQRCRKKRCMLESSHTNVRDC